MKCLVVMPFRSDFDPVFACVRGAANSAFGKATIDCYWLKDVHAAGRITEDIVHGLKEATFCVADLTENNPNVMWETGYAMALGKPTILIGQSVQTIPFDLKMHRILEYQIDRLDRLSDPLAEAMRQTLARYECSRVSDRPGNVFWLGHDLARAIRLAMFEPGNRVELEKNLLGSLHHMNQVRVNVDEARRLLLGALALSRADLSLDQRKGVVIAIANAKNELGERIAQNQPDFKGYPTLEEIKKLKDESKAGLMPSN